MPARGVGGLGAVCAVPRFLIPHADPLIKVLSERGFKMTALRQFLRPYLRRENRICRGNVRRRANYSAEFHKHGWRAHLLCQIFQPVSLQAPCETNSLPAKLALVSHQLNKRNTHRSLCSPLGIFSAVSGSQPHCVNYFPAVRREGRIHLRRQSLL